MYLEPIALFPAFRSGAATPWGGTLLREALGKNIPDAHTGESLEMSVIPQLESFDAQGHALSSLISQYGQSLVGTEAAGDFPLLLKLIDARERLSVQVHPDDAYARAHENKLGKTEAWVILRCEPDAKLVYGLKSGVTPERLRAACQQGKAVESLLRFVPVQAGDVFYIPAGMVHAIGGGILLYEIQQSSDVTYRFYDWDRKDAQGQGRPLHIRQALDVTRLDLPTEPVRSALLPDAHCRREALLDTPYFCLQRLRDCKKLPFTAEKTRFSVLTALADGAARLSASGKEMPLKAGQTLLIPACCADFTLDCPLCLLAAPAHKRGRTA